jgi:hypothetical protein
MGGKRGGVANQQIANRQWQWEVVAGLFQLLKLEHWLHQSVIA